MQKHASARHYTTRAIEALKKQVAHLMSIGDTHTAQDVKRILGWLEQAVVFALPDGGRLLDNMRPLSLDDIDILHLPYPVVALEYHVGECNRGNTIGEVVQTINTPRRIALCVDFTGEQAEQFCPTVLNSRSACPVGTEGGVMVAAVCESTDSNMSGWFASSVGAVISRDQSGQSNPTLPPGLGIDEKDVYKATPNPLSFAMEPLVHSVASAAITHYGHDRAMAYAYADLIDELNATSSFIQAMACSNIIAERVPADHRLNKKRVKSGKIPYSDYHVLKIRLSGSKTENSRSVHGDRRTPREHLRRGHIRRLSDGRRIWVNPCIVAAGSKGKAHKSYKVAL